MRSGSFSKAALAGAAIALGVGCTTQLESRRIADTAEPLSPSAYYLSKRVFEGRIAWQPRECDSNEGLKFEVDVQLRAPLVADKRYIFEVPRESLISGLKTTTFAIAYFPDRTIRSINSRLSDKTAEVVANLLDTASSIAGSFFLGRPTVRDAPVPFAPDDKARAPDRRPPPIAPGPFAAECRRLQRDLINYVEAAQALQVKQLEMQILADKVAGYTTALGAAAADHERYINSRAVTQVQLAAAKAEAERLDLQVKELGQKLVVSRPFRWEPDWDDKSVGAPRAEDERACGHLRGCEIAVPEKAATIWGPLLAARAAERDRIRFSLDYSSERLMPERQPEPLAKVGGLQEGVLIRVPLIAALSVRSGPGRQARADLRDEKGVKLELLRFAVPQAGPVMLVKLRNSIFQTNNVAVEFTEDGRLIRYEFGEEARLVAATASAARTAAQVQQIIRSETAIENEKLKAERDRLQFKKEIRTLRQQGIE
jgi:hypothetical protein